MVRVEICVAVIGLCSLRLDAANDDLQLMWKVPKESQFLGFCADNGNGEFTAYVISPEAPITIFSSEHLEEDNLPSARIRKKSRALIGCSGFEVIYLRPEFVFETPPYRVESLFLPSESISGEVSAILGGPFFRDCVLKYEPSKGKAQIRRSSIEVRQPIRAYSGRRVPGKGLALDGIKLNGKETECRLSFCADMDLVLGDAMQMEFSSAEIGHMAKLDLLTKSNPIVQAPVEKQIAFISRIDLDAIVIDKVCCLFDHQSSGLQIGWSLLQDFDFEIEFHGSEFDFRIYDTTTTRNKLHRKSELECIMTDDGLRIVGVANWSVLSQYLQPEDFVVRAGQQTYPGDMRRNAEVFLLSQRFNGGTIEVIRNSARLIINIPKDESSFETRDRFLFKSASQHVR